MSDKSVKPQCDFSNLSDSFEEEKAGGGVVLMIFQYFYVSFNLLVVHLLVINYCNLINVPYF